MNMSDALHISALHTPKNELSQARLAAEAAFLPPTPVVVNDDGPVIVVKRKKAVVTECGYLPDENDEHAEESRAPKVYRVDHGPESDASDADADAEGEGEGEAAEAGGAGHHEEISVKPVAPLKRRRRVKRHGEVTIIRPPMPEGIGETVMPSTGEPVFSEKSVQELAALKRRALADLARVQSAIQELERQAEAAWKVEVAQAVTWIRKSMAEYDLKLADLGL